MRNGIRDLPPSRRNKKQIVAHLDADLVERAHGLRRARALTIQEIVGDAVNRAVATYGRPPLLTVGRERLVKRRKALAKVQESEATPECRTGKRRLAAWFDRPAVDKVAAFAKEVGTKIEHLVEKGLRQALADVQEAESLEAA